MAKGEITMEKLEALIEALRFVSSNKKTRGIIPHVFTFFTNILTKGTRKIEITRIRKSWKAVTIVTLACTEAAIIPI